jgi:YesN/AraC family two-component response regulator
MKTIVIVEDEQIIVDDLIRSLNRRYNKNTINIKSFDNVQDCIYYLQNNNIDIIIIDIKLNGKVDGIQLAKYINEKYNNTNIFFLSASSTALQKIKNLHINFVHYFLKPYINKQLIS